MSFLCGPSYPSDGTCIKGSREASTFIPCHLAASQISCLTAAHFSARPTHRLLSLSSLCVSFLQTHLCVSLSPSHNYDLGVRFAPTPSQPWIKLPCHYSVVPPARVLHVRHSGACLPACCLPLWTCGLARFNHRRPWSLESLQLWHRLTGKWCRQGSGGVSCSFRAVFSISCGVKETPA